MNDSTLIFLHSPANIISIGYEAACNWKVSLLIEGVGAHCSGIMYEVS